MFFVSKGKVDTKTLAPWYGYKRFLIARYGIWLSHIILLSSVSLCCPSSFNRPFSLCTFCFPNTDHVLILRRFGPFFCSLKRDHAGIFMLACALFFFFFSISMVLIRLISFSEMQVSSSFVYYRNAWQKEYTPYAWTTGNYKKNELFFLAERLQWCPLLNVSSFVGRFALAWFPL